jgi:peptidase E
MKTLPAVLLFAGGPSTKKGTYSAALERAYRSTGKTRPRIAYLGAASGDDARFFGFMHSFLQAGGACDIELAALAGKKAAPAKARRVVEAADLVFAGGGDVEEGMKWLEQKEMVDWLRKRREAGQPFLGVSAGAIMLCRQWVRWSDPDDDASAELFDCLGIADALCDTHGEDDGWCELQALVRLAGEGATGHGIRTGGAVEVSGSVVETITGTVDAFTLRGGRLIRS